jgi:hypothetical protein
MIPPTMVVLPVAQFSAGMFHDVKVFCLLPAILILAEY